MTNLRTLQTHICQVEFTQKRENFVGTGVRSFVRSFVRALTEPFTYYFTLPLFFFSPFSFLRRAASGLCTLCTSSSSYVLLTFGSADPIGQRNSVPANQEGGPVNAKTNAAALERICQVWKEPSLPLTLTLFLLWKIYFGRLNLFVPAIFFGH